MNQESKKPIEAVDPLFDLTQDAMKHLDAMDGEIKECKKDLDALEEIGLDVSRLREKINWSEKAREIILKRFTKPK